MGSGSTTCCEDPRDQNTIIAAVSQTLLRVGAGGTAARRLSSNELAWGGEWSQQNHALCVFTIELLDIECALCHVTGSNLTIKIVLINPSFCGDNFLTNTR